MSYHISNFGASANVLQRFADIDGYEPEAGDEHEDLRWDSSGPGWAGTMTSGMITSLKL